MSDDIKKLQIYRKYSENIDKYVRRCYNNYEEMKKYAAYLCVAIGGGMEI